MIKQRFCEFHFTHGILRMCSTWLTANVMNIQGSYRTDKAMFIAHTSLCLITRCQCNMKHWLHISTVQTPWSRFLTFSIIIVKKFSAAVKTVVNFEFRWSKI